MAVPAKTLCFQLQTQPKSTFPKKERVGIHKLKSVDSFSSSSSSTTDTMLQPRVCTLRSYGSGSDQLVRRRKIESDGDDGVSSFFSALSDYIDNSKKTQDFEIISGRFAMVVFAATVTVEIVTGNSLFRKMDIQEIAKIGGMCFGAVFFAAGFAWFSSSRGKVGTIFTTGCNTFIDSLIDNLIDGLFYDNDLWSDDL